MTKLRVVGYAIVPIDGKQISHTSDWVGLTLWQIYKTRRDANIWVKEMANEGRTMKAKVVPVRIVEE